MPERPLGTRLTEAMLYHGGDRTRITVVPVTARLSRKFYERLGDEVANELVDWFNAADLTYRADLERLNEPNFERFGEHRSEMERRFASVAITMERLGSALTRRSRRAAIAIVAGSPSTAALRGFPHDARPWRPGSPRLDGFLTPTRQLVAMRLGETVRQHDRQRHIPTARSPTRRARCEPSAHSDTASRAAHWTVATTRGTPKVLRDRPRHHADAAASRRCGCPLSPQLGGSC